MIRLAITLRRKQVIVDVDTQKDLFLAEGKACVRNHRRILANIRRVIAWARHRNIRVISTVRFNASGTADCCIAGTEGQKKISYTVRARHITFPPDNCTDLPREIFRHNDQIILQKRCIDPFDEPRADRMLSELKVTDFIIVGAIIEDAVKATALGLLARRKNVTILTDAVGYYNKDSADVVLRQLEAKGARLAETKDLFGHSHLKLVNACSCDRCRGKAQKTPAVAN